MILTPASLKTPRREDLKARKKSLCPASPLCVLASLRESIFINCTATCLISLGALITADILALEQETEGLLHEITKGATA